MFKAVLVLSTLFPYDLMLESVRMALFFKNSLPVGMYAHYGDKMSLHMNVVNSMLRANSDARALREGALYYI